MPFLKLTTVQKGEEKDTKKEDEEEPSLLSGDEIEEEVALCQM